MSCIKRITSLFLCLALLVGFIPPIAVHAEAAQDERTSVSATLGETPVFDGLELKMTGDGAAINDSPEYGEKDGIGYWTLSPKSTDNSNSFYLRGFVDDAFLSGTVGTVEIDVTYYDGDVADGHWGLAYRNTEDGTGWGDPVKLGGTGTWLTHTFVLTDAVMNNDFSNATEAADFRLGLYVDGAGFYMSKAGVMISKVAVRKVEQETEKPAENSDSVSATLGEAPVFDGLELKMAGDGTSVNSAPEYGTIDGVNYWALKPKSDENSNSFYLNAFVDDGFLSGNVDYVEIDVTYYDGDVAEGHWGLAYRNTQNGTGWGDTVTLGGTGEWKTHTFKVDDAVMNNDFSNPTIGADFRLGLYVDTAGFYMSKAGVMISKVVVRKVEKPENKPVDNRESVSATLGETPEFDGLEMKIAGDGAANETPEYGVKDGVSYWALKPKSEDPNSFYLRGFVDDSFLYGVTDYVVIDVTYYDGDTAGGHWSLAYRNEQDGTSWGDTIQLGGTGKWLTHSFAISGAVMNNDFSNATEAADFRLGLYVDAAGFYMSKTGVMISKVVVRKAERTADTRESVSAILGEVPTFDGLELKVAGDGAVKETPEYGTKGGIGYWALKPKSQDANGFYMRAFVEDSFLYGATDYILIDVTYYDGDTAEGHWSLAYRNKENGTSWGDTVKLGGTGEWLTHTFVVEDAVMNNDFTNPAQGADFRLGLYVDNSGYYMSKAQVLFSKVVVRKAERPQTVTVQAESDNVGNIFFNSDPFDLTLKFDSNLKGDNTYTVHYAVRNHNGLAVKDGSWQQIFRESTENTATLDFLSDITAYGTYTLDLAIVDEEGNPVLNEIGDELLKASIPFSRVRSGGSQLDWLGSCSHFDMDRGDPNINIPLMVNAGFKFNRNDIRWDRVEKQKGVYDFSVSDSYIDIELANGVEPLVIVDFGNALYGGTPTTEAGLQAFVNYCTALANQYKGKVQYFEIWNEWNLGMGVDNAANRDGTSYAKVLVAASEAIRSVIPDAYILGMAIGGAYNHEEYIGAVLDYPGAYEAMDAVVMHPYTWPNRPEGRIEQHLAVYTNEFEEHNLDALPIWITEIGWPTHESGGSTEALSAACGIRTMLYTMANSDKIERYFWYDFQNDGTDRTYSGHNYGLIDCWKDTSANYSAKVGYAAFSAFASQMSGYAFDGETVLDDVVRVYRFKDTTGNRDDMLVLWTEAGSKTIQLSAESGTVKVTDIFGNTSTTTGADANVYVSELPVYLVGNFAAEIAGGEAGFVAEELYKTLAGSSFTISVTRNAKASQLSGSYELTLPTGWACVSGTTFHAAEQDTDIVDQIVVQVPVNATIGNNTVELKAVGEDGEVYLTQLLTVMVNELQPYEMTPYLYNTDDFSKWALAVKVNNLGSTSTKSGTVKIYDIATGEPSLLYQAEYNVNANESQTLLFDWDNPGQKLYKLQLVAADTDGKKTVIAKNVSFLAAVALRDDQALTVDGILAQEEWDDAMSFTLENYCELNGTWSGNDDLAATGKVKWDVNNLYLALTVTDDAHYQKSTDNTIWGGDSIQFSVDPTRTSKPGDEGNSQTGFALNDEDGKVYNYQWLACLGRSPQVLPEDAQMVVTRVGDTTIYEAAIPWEYITNSNFQAEKDSAVGFSILVNDNDAGTRKGYLEYMSGIGSGNNVNAFGDLLLVGNAGTSSKPGELEQVDIVAAGAEVTSPVNGWAEGTNSFTVKSSNACVVLVSNDNGVTYTVLKATATDAENTYSFTAKNVTANTKIVVALKGDANGDGKLTVADRMLLNRALQNSESSTELDAIAKYTCDLNGDGTITVADRLALNRALVDADNIAYAAPTWDE